MNTSDYNGYRLGLSINHEATMCEFIIRDGKAVVCDGWDNEGTVVDLPQSVNAKTEKSFFNNLAKILLKYLCDNFPNDYLPMRIVNDRAAAVVEVYHDSDWYGYLTSKISADKVV